MLISPHLLQLIQSKDVQKSIIQFSSYDGREVERFRSYIKNNSKINSSIFTGTDITLVSPCSREAMDRLRHKYFSEFGIDVNSKDPNGRLILNFTRYTLSYETSKSLKQLRQECSPSSMLGIAINNLEKDGRCRATDHVSQMEYIIRPVFLKSFKRGEAIQGKLTVIGKNGSFPVNFAYER